MDRVGRQSPTVSVILPYTFTRGGKQDRIKPEVFADISSMIVSAGCNEPLFSEAVAVVKKEFE